MHTPSLHRRVVSVGAGTVLVLAVGLNALLYLTWRSNLLHGLDSQLESSARLIATEAARVAPDELAQRLDRLGVDATLWAASGEVFRAGTGGIGEGSSLTRSVALPDGGQAQVALSRSDADSSLQRLLARQTVGTGAAAVLAFFLLRLVSDLALRPLGEMAAAIGRTAAGLRGERLRPDRADTELGKLASAYDGMLDELEVALDEARASEARSRRFLADAAHQLRTPVAGIQACAEALLLIPGDPRTQAELLGDLSHDTSRAGRLIKTLLLTAHLDEGLTLTPEPCDVVALCEEEMDRVRSFAPGLDLSVTSPGRIGLIELDLQVFREIAANLLDNARRHARSSIQVRVSTAPSALELRVVDDGPGLAPDQRESAFERFVSLDGAGGSGLGLPIARGMAEALGGSLAYEGRAFVLVVPYGDHGRGILPK